MSGYIKDDVSKILSNIDAKEYSHVIICINRLTATIFFKCVGINENLEEEVLKIRDQGIYAMVTVEEIGNIMFSVLFSGPFDVLGCKISWIFITHLFVSLFFVRFTTVL